MVKLYYLEMLELGLLLTRRLITESLFFPNVIVTSVQ